MALLSANPLHAQQSTSAAKPDEIIARVGDTDITRGELAMAVRRTIRQTFYHAKPPEGQEQAFRRKVAQQLVNRVLLLQEARRRSIEPDAAKVQAQLDAIEKRYRDTPGWAQQSAQALASITTYLQENDQLRQLEQQVRRVDAPSDAELRDYYEYNLDKFTEPERVRVSIILIKTAPSAPPEAWKAATQQAQELVVRLKGGADFGDLAREHSAHTSSEKGGDMGYVHRGMLNPGVEDVIDKLSPGDVTEPVRILEGIAIFRLDERIPATQLRFEDVQKRANQLWLRAQSDGRWQALQEKLRNTTLIELLDPSLAG
jgi:parvulin-like peptidyl-prolyl isomerase